MIVDAVNAAYDRLHDDRKSDAGDKRDQLTRVTLAQWSKRNAIQHDPSQAGDDEAYGEAEQQWITGANDPETDERGEHEDRRVRQIEDVEDTEDERIPDREERVCRPEKDAVGELLT